MQRASIRFASAPSVREMRKYLETGTHTIEAAFDLAAWHIAWPHTDPETLEAALRNLLVLPDGFLTRTTLLQYNRIVHLIQMHVEPRVRNDLRWSHLERSRVVQTLQTLPYVFKVVQFPMHSHNQCYTLMLAWHEVAERTIARRMIEFLAETRPIPLGVLRSAAQWSFRVSTMYEPWSSRLLNEFWAAVPDAVDSSLVLTICGRILKCGLASESLLDLLLAINPPPHESVVRALEVLGLVLGVSTPGLLEAILRLPLSRIAQRPVLVEFLLSGFETGAIPRGALLDFALQPYGRAALIQAGAEARLMLASDAYFDSDPQAQQECVDVVSRILLIE